MHIRFFMNLIFFPQAPSDIPFAPGPILSPQYVVGTQHMLDEEDEHEEEALNLLRGTSLHVCPLTRRPGTTPRVR